jgi:hypothetical protein
LHRALKSLTYKIIKETVDQLYVTAKSAYASISTAYALTGDQTATLDSLERAAEAGVAVPIDFDVFDFLRNDPRFVVVAERLGFRRKLETSFVKQDDVCA